MDIDEKKDDFFDKLATDLKKQTPMQKGFNLKKFQDTESESFVIILDDNSELVVYDEGQYRFAREQIEYFRKAVINPTTDDWKLYRRVIINEILMRRIDQLLLDNQSKDIDASILGKKEELERSQISLLDRLGLTRAKRIEQGKEMSAHDIYQEKLRQFMDEYEKNPELFYMIQCPSCGTTIQSFVRRDLSKTFDKFDDFVKHHDILIKESIPEE